MHETPKPEPVRPNYPVEIGAPSPVTPQKHTYPPAQPSGSTGNQQAVAPHEDSSINSQHRPSNASIRSDSLNGANNIDSVIQAWNAPLKPRPAQDTSQRPESRASAPSAPSPVPETSPGSVRVADPYGDMEPEFKASLNRYAAMLRKEAAAATDEDKFDIFQAFVTKELRLRSLLYGVELKKAATKEVKKAASLADIQAVLPKSALPSAGANPDLGQIKETLNEASDPMSTSIEATRPSQPPAQPASMQQEPPAASPSEVASNTLKSAPQPQPLAGIIGHARPKSRDDGYVMVSAPGGEEAYSPGGRPLVTKVPAGNDDEAYSPGGRPLPSTAAAAPAKPTISTMVQEHLRQPQQSVLSPSNDAPMVIEDYLTAQPVSPSINAPIVVTPEPPGPENTAGSAQPSSKPVVPIKFEPARPAYTPFRYNAGVQEEKKKTLQPAEQSYSTLRNSQADSGRLLTHDPLLLAPARPTSTTGRKEHEEAFIGLIRSKSTAVRQKTPGPVPPLPSNLRPATPNANASGPSKPEPPPFMRVGTPSAPPVRTQQPADLLNEALASMRTLLPSLEDLPTPVDPGGDNTKLRTIKSKIDTLPDQFSFIHDTVVDWDRTNRLVRKEQDEERRHRQEESEAHIDGLFNDDEIGYADIGELEAEFKLSEAEKKYQEDQAELESFTNQVFAVVTDRLQKEIAELTVAYTTAIDLLDLESVAVSGCFKNANSHDQKPVRMTEIMSCVLSLFNKIEIRHRKLAEAHVERERRRKHLELTVLYTNGDVQGVKQLEKEFAAAEKMAVLHEARGKDTRANKLMDTFDRATVRGLGDNQVFTDDLLARLQNLKKAVDSVFSGSNNTGNDPSSLLPSGTRDALQLAQSTLETISSDSRRILALSSEGDILLNDADYNVSVAEARVANADKATYSKLEDEKAKEDGKLIEEMDTRVRTVTKGPAEGVSLVKELLSRVGGVATGAAVAAAAPGVGAPGTGMSMADEGHEERIKRALEAAKMRNAGKT
jgi:hypothetical protein